MDEYTVEIDDQRDDLVVLAVPSLRLLVFGRTLDEAMSRARASIACRLLEGYRPGVATVILRAATDAVAPARPTAA